MHRMHAAATRDSEISLASRLAALYRSSTLVRYMYIYALMHYIYVDLDEDVDTLAYYFYITYNKDDAHEQQLT